MLSRGKQIISILALTICGVLIYLGFSFWDFGYLVRGARGIDVSHHQGQIDWSKLASSDITFAYIKVTEGGDFVDPDFKKNWQAAREAGLIVGAYHFFRLCRPVAIQSENFLATLPSDPGQLPPVIDIEDEGRCDMFPTPVDIAQQLLTMSQNIEEKAGCKPIIYASSTFEANLVSAMERDQTYWVPSQFWPPSFQNRNWIIWQYTSTGRVNGMKTDVDLNVFRGTREGLAKYVEKSDCFRRG